MFKLLVSNDDDIVIYLTQKEKENFKTTLYKMYPFLFCLMILINTAKPFLSSNKTISFTSNNKTNEKDAQKQNKTRLNITSITPGSLRWSSRVRLFLCQVRGLGRCLNAIIVIRQFPNFRDVQPLQILFYKTFPL